MATVIDALVVTLGMDAAEFKRGAKDTDAALNKTSTQATKTSKDMEAWGKNAAFSLSKLRNEALSLLAVFTAGMGIKNFVESTIGSTASLARMSENLGVTTKDLAMWQLANKNAGGSVEGMTAQLQEAQKAVADYKLGISNSSNASFFTVGGKGSDLSSPEALLRARSNIIQRLIASNGIDVARSKASDMGVSENTFNLLKKGAVEVDRLRLSLSGLAEQQARMAPAAEEFRKKWDAIKNQFETVGVKILTNLMPLLDRLANWLDAHKDDIARWADKVVQAVGDFVVWIDKAARAAGGWSNVLVGLIALNVLSAIGNLITLARALTSVGTALGVIGGAGSIRALSVIRAITGHLGVGAALLLHTEGLNSGEDEELAMRRGPNSPDAKIKSLMASGMGYEQAKAAATPARTSAGAVVAYFMSKGWTREQAAGIAANFSRESNFNPNAVGDGGKAYGLGQWHPDRQKEFKKFMGKDMYGSTAEEQMAFAQYELTQGKERRAGDALRKASNARQAGGLVSYYYERPADGLGETYLRGRAADKIAAANTINVASAAGRFRGRGASGDYSSTSETNINGPINIMTQARDAEGIARDLRPALNKHLSASQTNTGLF